MSITNNTTSCHAKPASLAELGIEDVQAKLIALHEIKKIIELPTLAARQEFLAACAEKRSPKAVEQLKAQILFWWTRKDELAAEIVSLHQRARQEVVHNG